MAKTGWTILLDDTSYRVACLDGDRPCVSTLKPFNTERAAECADEMRTALDELGYAGQPLQIALGAQLCLCVTLPAPSLRQRRNRAAMSYLLEAEIPWAVEEAIFDFELNGGGMQMVATQLSWLNDLCSALASRSLRIASISPTARLALEHHLSTARKADKPYVLIWGSTDGVEIWSICDNKPSQWQHMPPKIEDVKASILQIAIVAKGTTTFVIRDLDDAHRKELEALVATVGDCESEARTEDGMICAAIHSAAAISGGTRHAPIELRRPPLAGDSSLHMLRRHVGAFQALIAILLLVAGLAFHRKASQLNEFRHYQGEQQAIVFRRLFPDDKVPVGIRARLESEAARLQGMSGGGGQLPQIVGSMTIVERILRSLPDDLRFRLVEVRIHDGELYLVGQVREHGHADQIAQALRAVGLEVAAPSTHQLDEQGVEFRLSATLQIARNDIPKERQ